MNHERAYPSFPTLSVEVTCNFYAGFQCAKRATWSDNRVKFINQLAATKCYYQASLHHFPGFKPLHISGVCPFLSFFAQEERRVNDRLKLMDNELML